MDNPDQSVRFIQAANEVEAEEDREKFEKVFGKVAPKQPATLTKTPEKPKMARRTKKKKVSAE